MALLAQQTIQPSSISMRWQEPYTSAALNRKTFKTMPRGVYRGFVITPGPSVLSITIDAATGGPITGYQGGAFDAAVGAQWSVAVHESLDGYAATVFLQHGSATTFTFDLSGSVGSAVYAAIDVQYQVGYPTLGQGKIVEAADLDADPTLLVIGKIEIPSVGSITTTNIIYDDAQYPRILPYASLLKDGFMSAEQAQIVEALEVPNASNAYEDEIQISTGGPQIIDLPAGDTYVVNGNDLIIFRNGIKSRKGRDYIEIDRGDGFGDQISWIGTTLKALDRLTFRGQAYAVALTNTLAILDETALVTQNVTRVNFTGTGVIALPDGPGRVKIVIPAASSNNASKSKLNNTSILIPNYIVVALISDGSIVRCDPRIPTHRPYGITAQSISPGSFGAVVLDGVCFNALTGVPGIYTGMDVYVAADGSGGLTPTPPDPTVANVFRIGIADCPDATASSSATDIVFDKARII